MREGLAEVGLVVTQLRLGDLAALAGVTDFPSRLKCAALPWNAPKSAIRSNLGEGRGKK
jgi:NifU-like protein involved in Fe-S cluster formation